MKRPVYTIGLVDDQPEELVMIELFLDRLPYLEVLLNESDPMKAIDLIEEKTPDILLLDMEMPVLNGIQLYQSLSYQPALIICSGHPQYVYEGSALNNVAYITKTPIYRDFEEAILRAVSRVDQMHPLDYEPKSLILSSVLLKGAKVNIPIDRILHIEVLDKVCTFQGKDLNQKARVTLERVLQLLPSDQFIQVHKSHIVNLNKITDFTNTQLFMDEYPDAVPIGNAYQPALWDRLSARRL